MSVTFTTTIFQAEGKNATGIVVPPEVITELGGSKKPAVKVSLNGYTYQTTVGIMGSTALIPVSSEHRAASGLKAGDAVTVVLELETAPRLIEVPDDLAAALDAAGARAAFDALATSRRKEFVRQVEEAKTAETRERRIAKVVTTVVGG
jgi:hypothetical protein